MPELNWPGSALTATTSVPPRLGMAVAALTGVTDVLAGRAAPCVAGAVTCAGAAGGAGAHAKTGKVRSRLTLAETNQSSMSPT
jgi:hypothetical protein